MRWVDTRICDRWTLNFPDLPDLGGWDVWDYWERERFYSLAEHLTAADTVMDVGAEFGGLSAVIATILGSAARMILVEPEPTMWPTIRAVFERNGLGAPIRSAVALMADSARDRGAVGEPGWPAVSGGVEDDDLEPLRRYRYLHNDTATTPTGTVDAVSLYAAAPPSALNIDVEGAELRVLQGAWGLLTGVRPIVWVSVHPDLMERDYGDHPNRLRGYMAGLGYHATHLATDHEEHWMFRHPQGR